MATATQAEPVRGDGAARAEGNDQNQETKREPLWGLDPNGNPVHIPVLGGTGKWKSGKSLFGLTIAPGENRTKCYDIELSCKGYQGLQMDYVDVPGELRRLRQTASYSALDLFIYWRNDILSIQPGSYQVIMVDPINDLESGLVAWVKSRHDDYGYKSGQSFEKTGGIFWSAVKEAWKSLLADIASRSETFYFTAHLRKEWRGGSPTSREKPAGKSTLLELAHLYLWLSREPKANGTVPEVPRCVDKLKDRLSFTSVQMVDGKLKPHIQPILPPAFDDCTPDKIRSYITKPADYHKLKKAEKVELDKMTEEERLELEVAKAKAEAEAEESRLERLNRQQALRDMDRAAKEAAEKGRTPPVDSSARVQAEDAAAESRAADSPKAEAEAEAEDTESGDAPFDPDLPADVQADLIVLKQQSGISEERWLKGLSMNTRDQSTNPAKLTSEGLANMTTRLKQLIAEKGAEEKGAGESQAKN